MRVGGGTGALAGEETGALVGANESESSRGTDSTVGTWVGARDGLCSEGSADVLTSLLSEPRVRVTRFFKASEVIVLGFLPTCKYNAATPATCGAAMDVPDFVVTPPVRDNDRIPDPAAKMSTQLPQLDQLERRLLRSIEPTTSAPDADAGE
jgi:hypothetical protein